MKSLLNGKMDICLFANKPGLCFKEAWQYRSSNYLYAVVQMGYVHQHSVYEGSNPSPDGIGIAKVAIATEAAQVRILLSDF